MASTSSNPGPTPVRLLVLVGPAIYDVVYGYFTETPKTFHVKRHPNHYSVFLKSKYAAVEVVDQEAAKELSKLIKAERAKDEIKRKEYFDQRDAWHMANPQPRPRPAREILAALEIQALP